MKVLLIGADGFLGSHILRRLLDQDYCVRAFLQAHRDHATIEGLDYEPFLGDILNSKDVEDALAGCDYVINTAAVTDVWPSRNEASWQINYNAVKILSDAVLASDVQKFIHVGTANSFGYGSKASPGDELTPYNFAKYGMDYMDSKKAAQDFLLQACRDDQLPVVIINPSFMIGEYDSKPGSGAMVLAVLQERLPFCSRGGRCVTYVGDVAAATVNALDKGRIGECYITGGTNLSYAEFFRIIADTAGVHAPQQSLPAPLLMAFAGLAQALGRLLRKPPMLSVDMARMSLDGHYFSAAKAIRELDLTQTDIETAVRRTVDWFEANGYWQRRKA